MNKILKYLFAFVFVINLYAGNTAHKEYYVSLSGSDKNIGSLTAPFATIEKARDAIRQDKINSPGSTYTVYLRSGIYHITKTIEFNKRDAGSDDLPTVFKPYKNEIVSISGGIVVPQGRIGKVTDTTVSNRFITRVKDNILQINYVGLNIDEGKILPHGFGRPYANTQMELFGREKAYMPARWPNSGYTKYTKVLEKGSLPCNGDSSNKGGIIEYEAKRIERWQNAEEPWISGYFCYGFADDAVPVIKVDPEKNQITTGLPTWYGFSAGESFNEFYGFNILEEIDLPGEYFVDKKHKLIYFYPFDNEDYSGLSLSVIEEPIVSVENSSNIYFENITFECTRGMGVYIEGGSDIHLTSCTLRNIGTVAVCIGKGISKDGVPASRKLGNFKGYLYDHQTWDRNCGTNQLIENCEIYNTGAGGIILGGGDRLTLNRGNNRVTNCAIHDFNRYEKAYRGAINLDGAGNVIDHNDIYNCPGVAIHLSGNNHLIEYNIIHDAVTDGNDMGAIYYGRNPSEQGNIIRYNFFHHNGNPDRITMSVYHDDGACGMEVYGNIFYKAGKVAVMIGGGNDIVYRNNVFIEAPLAFHIDNRLQNWAKEEDTGVNGIYRKRLAEVGIDRLPYMDAYPNLANYWTDSLGLPKRNIIENNIFYNVGQIHNGSSDWVKLGKNYFTSSDPGFESIGKMNFKLRENSEVFKELPDFDNIPFDRIGRQADVYTTDSGIADNNESISHLRVHNNAVVMNNFLGVNGVYHGFAFMPEQVKKGMNDKDREREFSRVKNMDLKIARTWYRPDWACGNSLYNNFNWESDKMQAFYKWLDEMKELKVDVALQAGWWFTKDTYFNAPDTAHPNPESDPERIALWVKESLHQLIEVKGYTNIKYLMLFTEPLNYNSGILPKGYTQEEYYEKVCRKINDKLVEAGLRTKIKIVGPNSGSTRTAEWIGWSLKNIDDIIDIYSWHDYNATRWDREFGGWKDIVEIGKDKIARTGKPFWIDEYGCSIPDELVRAKPDYGNYLAQCIAAFTNAGAQTSLIWLLFDQQYVDPLENANNNDSFHNGVHRWGLAKWPHDSINEPQTPYPAWYAFSMMSKYLGGRNDTKVLRTNSTDSLYILATCPNNKELSVMVVNAAHSPKKFEVKFSSKIDKALFRHLYNPAEIKVDKEDAIINSDKKFVDVKDNFYDELPARAVAIYTTEQ
ncbi:MAG: right-handed parallel beta-helix repeat-containing protein [Ignavibacteriaceae bacterium]|nr:right-handed parallel beta-helix repeat-containing protein [Ignavibacteriaceae bacterium]